MITRFSKLSPAGAVTLALAGALLTFGFTETALGAAPPTGVACQATDGKISGRGATFQTKAQNALIAGYTSDVCGPVANQFTGDPAGSNMIAYNYSGATGHTGSGEGLKAASCRTDAFAGSDIPYFQADLTQLWGAAGSLTGANCSALGVSPDTFAPPYTPAGPTWPNTADATKNMMSFPVAGASVAIGVHIAASATCATPPTTLQFSTQTMSRLIGGDYANWNAPELVADNAGLNGCSTPITRVVRMDKSGTTQTFKNYLAKADPNRTGAVCEPTTTWTTLAQSANNQTWPVTGTCAPLTRPTTTGGAAVVSLVGSTDGAVGYADLADWGSPPSVTLASLQNSTSTAFIAPNNGAAANCAWSGTTLPGSGRNDAVGLNPSATPGVPGTRSWADDASPNVNNVTFIGAGYPICGFTWDFVFTGLNDGTVANAIAGLTADQRRTLYSYFTYVFSPAAQSRLAGIGYAPLPTAWLTTLRQGFQANF
jgi:ABC-type phosphate transport system substrate-binding protein